MSAPDPTGTTETAMTGETAGRTPPRSARRPLVGGPGYDEASPDGVSTLRLHAVIAVMATVLCAFVTVIFFGLGSIVPAIVFAVITLACIAIAVGATARIRRARAAARRRGQ